MTALTALRDEADALASFRRNAELYVEKWSKGRWRTARKRHACDAYFEKICAGDGFIRQGDIYFDTEELREYTKGPVFYRVCTVCANGTPVP